MKEKNIQTNINISLLSECIASELETKGPEFIIPKNIFATTVLKYTIWCRRVLGQVIFEAKK